ncbi:MAG: dTMP kinase [Nitrospirae bacterium]|nr:dTMP kinase [Nitrospirota bacterium]
MERQGAGVFISFEGIEGSGKTTQARLLYDWLSSRGCKVVLTHEPGGTPIGKKIREVILHEGHGEMSFITELLLYNADRAQHLTEKILPMLMEGRIVITDRFSDSTIAYQCYGRGIDISLIRAIDSIASGGLKPHMTILFDLDVKTGLMRNRKINKVDRLELQDIEFHERVRKGYLELAAAEPERIKVVDASMPAEDIREKVIGIIELFYKFC